MWRYTGNGEHIGAGVPARDMSDEEFEAVEEAYGEQFPDQQGALRTCGLYRHDPPSGKGARPAAPDPAADTEEVNDG